MCGPDVAPGPGENECRSGCGAGAGCVDGEAGTPVTVVSLPGRRAAGGRPQGRP
jgi:hypothetical protein